MNPMNQYALPIAYILCANAMYSMLMLIIKSSSRSS